MFCENQHPAATMCEIFLTPDAIYFVTELQDLGHNVSIQKKFFFWGGAGGPTCLFAGMGINPISAIFVINVFFAVQWL